MNPSALTTEEIRETGLKAIQKALGPIGAIKFIQLFYTGKGDYSSERHRLLKKASISNIKKWLKSC